MVAVLHDVVEDTAVTFDDLEREGFSAAVLAALRCVTHAEGESYADYVVRCRADPIAREVKLSDLADNTRLSRTIVRPGPSVQNTARFSKYLLSYAFLTHRLDRGAVSIGRERSTRADSPRPGPVRGSDPGCPSSGLVDGPDFAGNPGRNGSNLDDGCRTRDSRSRTPRRRDVTEDANHDVLVGGSSHE